MGPLQVLTTLSVVVALPCGCLRVLPLFQHLLELHPHEETPEPTLQQRHDLGQTIVPHVLKLGQDARSEEHLQKRHSWGKGPVSPDGSHLGKFSIKEPLCLKVQRPRWWCRGWHLRSQGNSWPRLDISTSMSLASVAPVPALHFLAGLPWTHLSLRSSSVRWGCESLP